MWKWDIVHQTFTIQLGYSAWASDGHRNSKFLRKSLEVRSQGPMNGHRPSANPTFGAFYIYIYIFISFHRYHRYLMFRLSILCSILFYLFSALLVAHHPILTSKTTVISPFPSQASHIVANISPHVHLVQPNILFLYSRQGYYPMVIYQFAIINGPWLPQLCVKLPEGNMLNVGKTLRNQPYVDAWYRPFMVNLGMV